MPSSLPAPSTEINGCLNAVCADANSSKSEDHTLEHTEEEYEDEEGDLDFNPLPSLEEASSSLSSELEGLEHDEEIVMQATVSTAEACKSSSKDISPIGRRKRKSAVIYERNKATTFAKEDGSSIGIGVVNDVAGVDLDNNAKKLILDMNDEDAICRRTRARYSLASFTLDELETFLQETGNEDDRHNFDDQEEYRKFLAAVLQDGDGNSSSVLGNENVDDEDEENDADFELEIEEALESDVDENVKDGNHEQEYEGVFRRPETRQNKRRKASLKHNKRVSEPLNRPLRPLLPYSPIAPFPPLDLRHMMIESAPNYLPSSTQIGAINIFTPHQIGQLHCLVHEHVQLLIQVFSLCVLEPSQQHTATEVQGLLSELLHKRDQSLVLKKISYPSFCFSPPYIHSSVIEEHPQLLNFQRTFESPARNAERVMDGYFWVPFLSGPVRSIMDVAPLNLVENYMSDCSTAVQEYKCRQLAVSCDTHYDKESLFPYQSFQDSAEANADLARESIAAASKRVPSPGSDQTPKKTVAATLVERTKRQSVALVPNGISKLAQRFLPLFNPALFPHKPPPLSVANRVLFTDAEDGLLARGLMKFNTDWKKIQEHFLPCKSEHQIFVRKKNRSCSRAPENPIKEVWKMKTSPLTAEEEAQIQEALKVFKYDWMYICKYVVPHRDPSMLPRQWRTAIGTQKSYKADEHKKAKRRLYDSMRKHCQPENTVRRKTSSDKEDGSTGNVGGERYSGNDCVDNEDEAYVHEAFLADWRPGTSSNHIENVGSVGFQSQLERDFPAATAFSVPINNTVSNVSTRSGQSKIILPAYQTRKNERYRIVKLAPDLPPVNLPPSVRVMSQLAFKTYQEEISSKALAANQGSWGPAKEISYFPCAMNSGTSHQTEAIQEKRNLVEKDESDLHMHPLLFQSPGNGNLPYYPLDCIKGASSSFNFFQKNPPQINIGLFHNTRHLKEVVNFPSNSLKFKGSSKSSSSIDFHPLLQRMDDPNFDLMTNSVGQPSSTSELLKTPFEQLQNPLDVLTNSPVNTSSLTADAITSSPRSRANELDLDIHLSFKARKVKEIKSMDKRNLTPSMFSSQEAGIIEFQSTSVSPHQHCNSSPILDENGNKLDSGAHALGISSSDVNMNSMNEIGEYSLPEIVMEQEELTDSEEEFGENVEFECEEMSDSEGEAQSDSDQIDNVQNKAKLPVKTNPRGYDASRSTKSTTPQEIHMDPFAATPFRKPRMRAQKYDSRTTTDQSSRRDSVLNTTATEKSPQSC